MTMKKVTRPNHSSCSRPTVTSPNNNKTNDNSITTKLQITSFNKKYDLRSSGRQLSMLIALSLIATISTLYSAEKMLIAKSKDGEINTHLIRRKTKQKIVHENLKQKEPIVIDHADLVHIINTRFMQNQGNLVHLGHARLRLFQVFCLPTVLKQSSQLFLWIIRIDPKLDNEVQSRLLEILDDATKINARQNLIVIRSNENPEGFRSKECLPDQKDVLYGSWSVLKQFHDRSQNSTLLETRLDADDGLHMKFVSYVQNLAKEYLSGNENDNERWLIWCVNKMFEWHAEIKKKSKEDEKEFSAGGILGVKTNYCVTPGLTYGLSPNTHRKKIPQHSHHKIQKNVKTCPDDDGGGDKYINTENFSNCILLLDRLSPAPAVRARTSTSAGMQNVGDISSKRIKNQIKLWWLLKTSFNIDRSQSVKALEFIIQNLSKIAEDNLEGQCTKGHSCKESSKEKLKQVINKRAAKKVKSTE